MLLAIEFFDELVFGVRETAWPSIRHDFDLSYVEIGVLLTVPDVVGSLAEPVLALARNRRRMILAGGIAFAGAFRELRRREVLRWLAVLDLADLRVSAAGVAVRFPAFLLVPSAAKLPLLAGLGLANAGWYAIPMARL